MSPDRPRRVSKSKQARQTPGRSSNSSGVTAPINGGSGFAESPTAPPSARRMQQGIPDAVANRMARRIALATGIPSVLGMAVFVASYVLVSRHLLEIPPSATLLLSGGFFLLGLLGLSYGVLSASWEAEPGSVLGLEQIPLNLGRLKASLRALREGPQIPGQ